MKKKSILALLLAGLMVLALAACGGSSAPAPAEEETAEAPDYLGTYNLTAIKMGPLLVTAEEFGFEGAYMELKEDGKLDFCNGTDTENVPYTVDGTAFTMEEGDTAMTGTIENGAIEVGFTASMLDGEGDKVIMTMCFAQPGSDAETAYKDALSAAGSMEDQMDAMSVEELTDFLKEFSEVFGG